MYLSIDFEDYNHDLKRSLGLWNSGRIKVKSLWEKYYQINQIYKNSKTQKGKYGTFFCTAVIAEKEPSLIKQIVSDGHEIGCHYYYHDSIINEDLKTFDLMLSQARDKLEDVSGTKIIGFRAPMFKINKRSPDQYKIVERLFQYDSSFFCNSPNELLFFKNKMNINNLTLIPIFSKKFCGKYLRLGGTYLKLFPLSYSYMMIEDCKRRKIIPQVYLHPYEFGKSMDLHVSRKEMDQLGRFSSTYWSVRQHQWLSIGNSSLVNKINKLVYRYGLSGKLCDLI